MSIIFSRGKVMSHLCQKRKYLYSNKSQKFNQKRVIFDTGNLSEGLFLKWLKWPCAVILLSLKETVLWGFPGGSDIKNLPVMQETQVQSLGQEDLEKGMATSILVFSILGNQNIPVFLPGEFHEQRSVTAYSPWGCKESDKETDTHTHTHKLFSKWMKISQQHFLGFNSPCNLYATQIITITNHYTFL